MSHNTENIFKAYNRGMPIGTAYSAGMRDQNAKDKVRRLHKSYGAEYHMTEADVPYQVPAPASAERELQAAIRDQSEDRVLPPYLLAYQDGPLHKGYYVMHRKTLQRVSGLYFSAMLADDAVTQSNNAAAEHAALA